MGADKKNVKKPETSGTGTKKNSASNAKPAAKKNQNQKRKTVGSAETTRRNAAKKAQREREIRQIRMVLLFSVAIGILCVIIVSMIMQSKYLKVKQLESEYNMGDEFKLKNYVEAVNDKATVELADADFEPEKPGSCEVEFIVQCGRLKKTKSITIKVVDQNAPVIEGPSTFGILQNEEISLLKYYTVEDEEPDLTQSLTIDQELDTSTVGSTEYTLYVTDWSDNSASKKIELVVCAYEGDKKTAALAVREYNRENGYGVSESEVYVYKPENMENTYVQIGDALYKVKDDEASVADENEDLSTQVKANGTKIAVEDIAYFNYNK